MSEEAEDTDFNFEGARRGPAAPDANQKTRITTYIDTDILEGLKQRAEEDSRPGARLGYQTVLNRLLREALDLDGAESPGEARVGLTEAEVRQIVRDELSQNRAG